MIYWLGANLVVIFHFLFICFVLLGGLLVYKWRWLIFLQLPSVAWGAWVEYKGLVCPLTPLENKLWIAGGDAGYSGGFIENYLVPLIYVDGLDHKLQIILGSTVILVNLAIYARLIYVVWIKNQKQ